MKEHGVLPIRSAVCRVLVAGERGGRLAALVFGGLAWCSLEGAVVGSSTSLRNRLRNARTEPISEHHARRRHFSRISGVGYVIGPRIAGTMVAGGWRGSGCCPCCRFSGSTGSPIHPNFANNPATGRPFLLSEMDPNQLWSAYPVHQPAACSRRIDYARAHDSVDRRVGPAAFAISRPQRLSAPAPGPNVTRLSSSAGPCCSQFSAWPGLPRGQSWRPFSS